MKNVVQKILVIVGICLSGQVMAQQNANYTQYIFNGLVINPAYAGSKQILSVSGLYRSQWVGLEGAPSTQTLSIDGAVLRNKVGLGLHIMNDQIGAQGQKSIYGSSAFRVNLSENARIALGLAGGVAQYYTDGSRLRPINSNDPTIPTIRETSLLPDAKAGLFFNTQRFYAGLSAANLVGFKNKFVSTPRRHFYLTSGYIFDINDLLKFKPSFLIQEDFASPASVDLNAFVLVGDRIWLGGTYRSGVNYQGLEDVGTNNAWALMTEIYLSPKLKIGYAHDFMLTGFRNYSTHEVTMGLYFFKKEQAHILSIRYF